MKNFDNEELNCKEFFKNYDLKFLKKVDLKYAFII